MRCPPAKASASINASHVVFRVVAYSEVPGDAGTVINDGRSEFTFATFSPLAAASPVWAATDRTALVDAFAALDARPQTRDAHRYPGVCSLAAAQVMAPTVGGVTNAPAAQWAPAMTTPQLTATTLQAAGCTEPAWAVADDGTVDAANSSAVDGPGARVFWREPGAAATGWAVRQTTCGGDPPLPCSPVRPFAYVPESRDATACSLRTEAMMVMELTAFLASGIPTETTPKGGSSSRTFAWSLATVEVASTASATASLGVNVFNWRVAYEPFTLRLGVGAAVTEVLPVGTVAAPCIISVMGSAQTGDGGPTMQRVMADGRVRMVWQTNAYVQQAPQTLRRRRGLLVAPTAPTTVLLTSVMGGDAYTPVWGTAAPGYSGTCSPWVGVQDRTPYVAGEDSTVGCALSGTWETPGVLGSAHTRPCQGGSNRFANP